MRKNENNVKVLEGRTDKVEEAGAFRRPLPGVIKNPFRRGIDAKWGPVEMVQGVDGSTVVGQNGTRVDIKLVQAVPVASGEAFNVEHEADRTKKKREKLFEMMDALHEWLGRRELSLKAASTHLKNRAMEVGRSKRHVQSPT